MNQQKDITLINKIRSQFDLVAKDELVLKYIPMVRNIVRNYHPASSDLDDFFQEGAIGLLKAIEEYNPNYQVKFSTFAFLCINRRVLNAFKRRNRNMLTSRKAISLFQNHENGCALIDCLDNQTEEPFSFVEKEWCNRKLDSVLKVYLSPVEYQVVKGILAGDDQGEIQISLALPSKVIDNARTRARGKLRKIIKLYGSLLSPDIPQRVRKRNDLTINLEVG